MSLLDDVSIVVTPNGYKAGELYAVVPTIASGTEQVVNGDFSNGETGWSISDAADSATQTIVSGGLKMYSGSAADNSNRMSQTTSTMSGQIGKSYILKLTATDFIGSSTGSIRLDGVYDPSNLINFTAATPEVRFIAYRNFTYIKFFAGGVEKYYTVDNVSLQEDLGADMDVTRATAATRVDEAGLVNYAEIIGSEEVTNGDFATDSDWIKGANWTIANNLATSDGSQTGNVSLKQLNSLTNLTIGTNYKVQFTISGYESGVINPHIRGVQSGNVSGNGTKTSYIIAGNGSDGINLYAGSTFVGSISDVSIKEVTRDNVPRIDYSGGGCPHILAEPQRTNLVIYSEDFSNAAWSKSSVGIDTSIGTNGINPNIAISPDGTLNSDRVNFLLQSDRDSGMYEIISASTGNSYTTSVYLKGEGSNIGKTIKIRIKRVTGGSFVSVDADYVLTGEWVRLEMNPLTLSGANSNALLVFTSNDATSCLMYGCQVEEGSYPTSIIPTSGSTVTRNQDIFTRDGIGSLINSTEGVFFAEWKPKLSSDYSLLTINNGTSGSSVLMGKGASSSTIFIGVRSGYSYQMLYTLSPYDFTNFIKVAVKWKVNDFAVWIDGVEVATDTSGNAPVGLNKLSFDFGDGGFDFYGEVKQLQVYKTALTDEQLIQLTGESGTDFYESYAEMASALTYTIQ